MDSKDIPLSLYGWRPSWIWQKKRVKGVEKFEPYDFVVIWSLMMQYPPLTQFGQTNLAKLHLSLYYYHNHLYGAVRRIEHAPIGTLLNQMVDFCRWHFQIHYLEAKHLLWFYMCAKSNGSGNWMVHQKDKPLHETGLRRSGCMTQTIRLGQSCSSNVPLWLVSHYVTVWLWVRLSCCWVFIH